MKKAFSALLSAVLLLTLLTACAKPVASLSAAELLDLGEKYLLEHSYEQALVQFLAVIEIVPMNPRGYIGAAEAYVGLGQTDRAEAILRQGLEVLLDNSELAAMLDEMAESAAPEPQSAPTPDIDAQAASAEALIRELRPTIESLDLPMTVDSILLGVSGIEEAKAAYLDRPFAQSHLMNYDTQDTVYTCYGMNDMPIPEGYRESEFGFLFAAPASGGGIFEITITDPSFLCLGALRIGDEPDALLALFGLEGKSGPIRAFELETDKGRRFYMNWNNEDSFLIQYSVAGSQVNISVTDGRVYSIWLKLLA